MTCRGKEGAKTLNYETVQLTDTAENPKVSTGYTENTVVFFGQHGPIALVITLFIVVWLLL